MPDFAKLSAYTASFIHESDERIREKKKKKQESAASQSFNRIRSLFCSK
ncbi:hypothetical protein QS257_08435 [Terrilactibacillus sp. S3-3]|nr:hypothetical protein QS257_08435 [Terrilactibacillus sp. S3-3]